MAKSPYLIIPRTIIELAFQALDDAYAEIEAMEGQEKWYTASPKMMDRIEKAMEQLQGVLK